MLAAVLHGATDLRVEDRPEPVLVPGELLVVMACGGICGSGLSCFCRGGVGDFRLREPLGLSREVAGTVAASAAKDGEPAVGTPVAEDDALVREAATVGGFEAAGTAGFAAFLPSPVQPGGASCMSACCRRALRRWRST